MSVVWALSLDEVPTGAVVPCVLLVQLTGSETKQRTRRRELALIIAEKAFARTRLSINVSAEGALRFFHNGQPAPLYLSHSTRGGFAAVAVAQEPIGVDLELLGPEFEPAWNILHQHEREALQQLAGTARHHAFLKIWTAKEACLKLEGQGLAIEPSYIEISTAGGENHLTGAQYQLNQIDHGKLVVTLATHRR